VEEEAQKRTPKRSPLADDDRAHPIADATTGAILRRRRETDRQGDASVEYE
jgi:hypothetical protein